MFLSGGPFGTKVSFRISLLHRGSLLQPGPPFFLVPGRVPVAPSLRRPEEVPKKRERLRVERAIGPPGREPHERLDPCRI